MSLPKRVISLYFPLLVIRFGIGVFILLRGHLLDGVFVLLGGPILSGVFVLQGDHLLSGVLFFS